MDSQWDDATVSLRRCRAAQVRVIAAAATVVNVLTGALALAALRWLNVRTAPMRYFLWLFAAVSFLMATWNMVTLPLLGEGDWGDVAQGLDHAGQRAAGVVAAGIVMTIVGYRLSLRLFLPDLTEHPAPRHKIALVAFSTMIIVHTLSITLSPFATGPAESNHLVASVFAYAHLAVWALLVYRGVGPCSTHPATDIALQYRTSAPALMVRKVTTQPRSQTKLKLGTYLTPGQYAPARRYS